MSQLESRELVRGSRIGIGPLRSGIFPSPLVLTLLGGMMAALVPTSAGAGGGGGGAAAGGGDREEGRYVSFGHQRVAIADILRDPEAFFTGPFLREKALGHAPVVAGRAPVAAAYVQEGESENDEDGVPVAYPPENKVGGVVEEPAAFFVGPAFKEKVLAALGYAPVVVDTSGDPVSPPPGAITLRVGVTRADNDGGGPANQVSFRPGLRGTVVPLVSDLTVRTPVSVELGDLNPSEVVVDGLRGLPFFGVKAVPGTPGRFVFSSRLPAGRMVFRNTTNTAGCEVQSGAVVHENSTTTGFVGVRGGSLTERNSQILALSEPFVMEGAGELSLHSPAGAGAGSVFLGMLDMSGGRARLTSDNSNAATHTGLHALGFMRGGEMSFNNAANGLVALTWLGGMSGGRITADNTGQLSTSNTRLQGYWLLTGQGTEIYLTNNSPGMGRTSLQLLYGQSYIGQGARITLDNYTTYGGTTTIGQGITIDDGGLLSLDSHARNNTQGIQAATSAQPVTVKRGGRALLHNHSTGTAVSVTSIASADIEEGGSISLDNDTAAIAATNIAGRATVRGDLSLNNSTIFQGLEIRERGVFLSGMRGGRIGEPGTNPPRLASLTFDPTAVYRPTIGLGMQPVLVAGPVSLNGVALRVLEQGVAPRGQYVFLAAVKAHGRIQGNFVLPPGDRYSVAIDQSDLILDRAILTVNTLAQE